MQIVSSCLVILSRLKTFTFIGGSEVVRSDLASLSRFYYKHPPRLLNRNLLSFRLFLVIRIFYLNSFLIWKLFKDQEQTFLCYIGAGYSSYQDFWINISCYIFWEFALYICNGKLVLLLSMLFLTDVTENVLMDFWTSIMLNQVKSEYSKFWAISN